MCDFCSAVVVPELDVDHAGDGICAINGRSAVFQDFNAVDRCARNGIEIDKSYGAISVPSG